MNSCRQREVVPCNLGFFNVDVIHHSKQVSQTKLALPSRGGPRLQEGQPAVEQHDQPQAKSREGQDPGGSAAGEQGSQRDRFVKFEQGDIR